MFYLLIEHLILKYLLLIGGSIRVDYILAMLGYKKAMLLMVC